MKIHLVDGTYELFRNHFGAPPKQAPDGRQVALGDLVEDVPIALAVDANAPTKPPSEYRIVGKPVPRVDIPDKVAAIVVVPLERL